MYMYYHLFLSPIASEVHHVTQYSSIIIIIIYNIIFWFIDHFVNLKVVQGLYMYKFKFFQ